jgi:lysozyme family protein
MSTPLDVNAILDGIIRREGGYVDHPSDRGGPTKYGITIRTLADWRGKPVTAEDVRDLSEAEARDIYRARYIAPFLKLDESPDVRPVLIDVAVNSGVMRAIGLLAEARQQAIVTKRPLLTEIVIARLLFYARIVRGDRSQGDFIYGWVNRAVSFL